MAQLETYTIRVAGVSHNQAHVRLVSVGDECELVPEPTNQYDENAVRVVHAKTGNHLGYVPRDTNQLILMMINAGVTPGTAVVTGTGTPHGSESIGICLEIAAMWPDENEV